ncbi:neuroepithelial cell-transforming gene 1 protein-like [Littorina saxatilis]|uniref:Rho guanine nucleotide exchange factor 3 n=1 Tax=Littorina saxatilis TaxID=31220 RepID=A0AAN9B9X4_9CAEN
MEPITMEPLPFEDFVFNNILPEEPPRDGESGDDFDCSLSTPPKENMQPSPAGSGGISSGKKILIPEGCCKSRSSRRLSLQSIDLPLNFMKRKRKRKQDEDTISITSIDSIDSIESLDTSCSGKSKPKRRSILRAYSLINILSPNKSKNTPRSSGSFKVPSVTPCKPALSPSPYRPPTPSPAKRRVSRTWTDSMAGDKHVHAMSRQVVKRQEAIYELYQGEKDISEDLINVRKMYRDSMMTLELCTSDEAYQIFGPLDQLIPVHQDLAKRLEQQRLRDGTTHGVGQQILDWVPRLRVYVSFCANQPFGKAMLNSKRNQPAFEDFLLRCQESPFSRKLDLWALLDGARGRFVKYPLLIKAILKETPVDHEDVALLHAAMTQLDDIIKQADNLTGQSECRFYKSQLVSLYDEQNIPEIEQSTVLICQGTLKNNKGTKLQLYLFDKVAVVTRNTSHGQNIYRQPIPVSLLVVEDLPDGEVRMGSFRSAFGQGQTSRNVFRISFTDPSLGQSHTLMANDEHNKQQWMRSFHSVTSHIIRVGAGNGDKK